jgi:hypothetical protein
VLTGKEPPRTGSVGVLGATGGHGLAKVAIYSPMRPRACRRDGQRSRHAAARAARRAAAAARAGCLIDDLLCAMALPLPAPLPGSTDTRTLPPAFLVMQWHWRQCLVAVSGLHSAHANNSSTPTVGGGQRPRARARVVAAPAAGRANGYRGAAGRDGHDGGPSGVGGAGWAGLTWWEL